MPTTLYLSAEPRQLYLVPDGTELPEGSLQLRSITGESRSVDPDVAEVFAVSEAEVGAHFVSLLKDVGQALLGAEPTQTPSEQKERLAAALGLSLEALGDPARVREALMAKLEALRQELRAARGDDPKILRERAERLADLARAHGAPELADAAGDLPNKLRELIANPELVGRLREASAELRRVSAELREQRKKPN